MKRLVHLKKQKMSVYYGKWVWASACIIGIGD